MNVDIIFISQSDVANYNEYASLPLDRLELFKELIYPRMVYFKEGFHSHLDIFNYFLHGQFFDDASLADRKKMLNIWNLPGFNGIHLANYLAEFNIKTRIINNFDTQWDDFCSAYEACSLKPVVAISTTFHLSASEIRRMAKKVKKMYPEASILLGGAFVNERYINGEQEELETIMRKNGIQYCLHAFNSEVDFKDLMLAIKKGTSLNEVNNLFYTESKDFTNTLLTKTKEVWNAPVLSSFNSLDQLQLDFVNYTLQLRSSSGCPFACAFCSYPTTAKGFHQQGMISFQDNIQHIIEKTGVSRLIFIDDTLNVPKSRFIEILEILKPFNIEWFSFLRVQFIDEEIAKLMQDSGCRAVYLGLESASDVILQNMNKKATKQKFQEGITHLKNHGIISIAAFIVGYPGETDATIQEDIDFIENSGIDFYTLKEFYYMKQTSIYEQREKFGLSGIGSSWEHSTMSYAQASQKKAEMFKNIRNCIFIDPDTSLWMVAYLYDQGFNFETIKSLQKEVNQIMQLQMNGNFSEDIPAFSRIKSLLSNN